MIKKLRGKFILVNMISVSSILLIVLAVFFTSYYQKSMWNTTFFMENELDRAMGGSSYTNIKIGRQDDGNPPGSSGSSGKTNSVNSTANGAKKKNFLFSVFGLSGTKDPDGPGNFLPSVVFKTDSDGNVLTTNERELTVDAATSTALVTEALSSQDSSGSGYLKDYGLRYIIRTSDDGSNYMIFADTNFEQSNIRTFLISCILIFVVAFILFLILSYFLARWTLAPVEKAWKQQSQFVADASHELKTPITVILANLNILGSHKEDTIAKQSRWIENTREEAERMKQLIQDLLFLAKSDADITPVIMSRVDLSNCLEDRLLGFESVAFEKKVELESSIEKGLDVIGNEGQLKQLITILLDNAVKYAGQTGKVNAQARRTEDKAVITVCNTGEPIPQDEISHIFERFYRTDKSRVHKEGGYGLGLSIADNIVKSHHGTIRCSSSAEKGTVFTVELPAVK